MRYASETTAAIRAKLLSVATLEIAIGSASQRGLDSRAEAGRVIVDGDIEIVKWIARPVVGPNGPEMALVGIDTNGIEYHPLQRISGAIILKGERPRMFVGGQEI